MEDITVQELAKKKQNGENFILIDVRETYEHQDINIGGRNIPLGDLSHHLEEFRDKEDAEIVVYCRSGNRSGIAKSMFEHGGFRKVRNMLGGMIAWQELKLPV